MTHTVLRPRPTDVLGLLEFIRERAASHVPAHAGKVLDVGSGEGYVLRHLRRARFAVGLDLSPGAPWPGQVAASLARMPFGSASFDAAVCVNVFNVVDHATVRRGLAEMARVVRPGGTLVVAVQNLDHPLLRLRAFLWKRRVGRDWPCALREGWLREELSRCGARVELCEWLLPHSLSRSPVRRGLAERYAGLAQRFPRLAPHMVVVARRV
ncbi:MAG: class I SAM-dependent methyltransferase [Planctomycetota bacterium]